MEYFIASLQNVLTLQNILFTAFGVALGYVVGAIPGMGKATATAVAIPLTFSMNPIVAVSFLIGISKGSTAGNAVSAILMNTPGEPSSVPTAMDGYPMAKAGKATKALKAALYASTFGDFFGTIILILLAAPLARFALTIGRVEIAAILIFALTFIAALSGKSLSKGLISGALGLLVATIGFELETGTLRMIPFKSWNMYLFEGIPLVPMAIGMIAFAEMLVQLEEHFKAKREKTDEVIDLSKDEKHITPQETRRMVPTMVRGTIIGTLIGILPGLGASIASFASYGLAKRLSKDPDSFGKGNIEGVAASESADNAVIPSSLVPLFALGIPGSAIAAILVAGFMVHGIIPGPSMFGEHPEFIFGVYASMILASLLMLIIGFFGVRIFALVIRVPVKYLFPSVMFFSFLGAYLEGGGTFGVVIMLIFGIFGYFVKKFEFSFVTFLIGFIIGPNFEIAIRQSLVLMRGNSPLDYPVAIIFLVITAVVVLQMLWTTVRRLRNPVKTSS